MAKRMIGFMLSLLFILSNTTFAANWAYLQRQEGTRNGPCTEYFDMDSVVKEKNKVIAWLLLVMDDSEMSNGVNKLLSKQEILLDNPMKMGSVSVFTYDSKDQELKRYERQSLSFYTIRPDSMEQNAIERVLLYAKNGKISDAAQPEHIITPVPKWYKAANLPDGELYLNLSTLMVWPQDPLNKLEVMAKLVWNEQSLEERKAELAALGKKKYPLDYENVRYTLFSYQFLAGENKCRIFEVTDYSAADHRTTLLDGITWHDIEVGSKDEAVLQACLNLLSNSIEKK